MAYFTKEKIIRIVFFLFSPWRWPAYLLTKYFAPVHWGVGVANFFFQRVLRINSEYQWPIHYTSRVVGKIKIGSNVWKSFAISGGCYIQGGNGIHIDDNTIFAPGVNIISANHSMDSLDKWDPASPVRIGKKCWIGANASILPGVELGDDVVVGANSVVTKSFPSGAIVAGVPAKLIRMKY